jgi:two-component system, cell cycle sensor histidine kinase and response regulator CckA
MLAPRMRARRILEVQDYRVIEANEVEQALAMEAVERVPIHLLLSDVVMPGLSGPEGAKLLAERRPELRILYMSGYPDETLATRGLQTQPGQLMPKPFSAAQLLTAVRRVLDAQAVAS